MQALIEVILPVFLLIGFGYIVVWRGLFPDTGVDGLMIFTQQFAIPCLLFQAISTLDLGQEFNAALLISFYTGAVAGFAVGFLGARFLFGRDWEDCVAIGFVCLFSNSLLLGLPITERAYGADALASNYAIIAVHSPICYGIGITAMEIFRNKGSGLWRTTLQVFRAMFRNALVIAVMLGFAVNLGGVTLPDPVVHALDLMVRAALPTALFALGGVLYRYRPDGDLRTIAFACGVSLIVHPAIVWGMGRALALDEGQFRSAVVTAAAAPGVNAYVFANMYGRARRVAASTVLIATALCSLTAWVWLALLG
ncbi:AEC family transporter [Roseicitreum antarcticum]|uniref:Malonate transporter n=1 Tax=Roseicitreum antarcticum TaxID=564137 RepID=A0A1H2RI39_9RHOB|nr:AEC family transporter [Roseicitreum antarcticum]SDW19081.1 hypothetical protein SAMN04488238_101326 [Roseicitreum antarcticum]